MVKPRDGGGTRSLKINENATKKELLESAKQLFCIKNKIKFGFVFNLKFELATFSEEIINDSIEIDGIQYPFKLTNIECQNQNCFCYQIKIIP